MSPKLNKTAAPRARRHNGYSLVELMVALTLGLVILAAVSTLFVTSKSSYNTQEDINAVHENGRHAIRILTDDVRLAGYVGLTYDAIKISPQVYAGAVTSACTAANWINIGQPIFGSNAASSTADANSFTGCIPAADYKVGTDILVVRHASNLAAPSSSSTFEATRLYLHAELDRGRFFTGNPPASDTNPASNHEMNVHVYYIRPYARTAGDGVPTLVREVLVAGPAMVTEPLVEGVENMQISYGIDQSAPGDNVVDIYRPASGVTDWTKIVSVRIELLVRAPTGEGGYTDTKTYPLGDYTMAAPSDNVRRGVFTTTIQMRNHRKT